MREPALHEQVVVRGIDLAARWPAPIEVTAVANALLTLRVPRQARVDMPDTRPPGAGPLLRLSEEDYVAMSRQGRGMPYPYAGPNEPVFSARMRVGLNRYAAANPGTVLLRVSQGRAAQYVRVTVSAPDDTPRLVARDESGRDAAIGRGDLLQVDLPGAAEDGWSVHGLHELGLRLVSIEPAPATRPESGSRPARTRLRFETDGTSSSARGPLVIRRADTEHRLDILRIPTPAC